MTASYDSQPSVQDAEPFFVGWAGIPARLGPFLGVVALVFVVGMAGASFLISATVNDPGDGTFRWGWGPQTLTGILTADPYPVLHITTPIDNRRISQGQSILLSGFGKRGVQDRAAALDGQLVQARGFLLTRGEIVMLQANGGADGLRAIEPKPDAVPVQLPESHPLGRWRIAGEICDGKCVVGAMRPGTGLAHRACANLCLIGGAPPVLVATDRIEGHQFFLLGDADGGPVTDAILNHVGMMIQVDGVLDLVGGLPVLRIDPVTLSLP